MNVNAATNKTKIKQTTLADRTLEQLQWAIIRGELPPGGKINEQELANQYGISRGPLREALQRLEQRHLIERIPHVGASVVSITSEKLIDLYQVRAELEAMACRLAAEHITPEQITKLNSLLNRQEQVFRQCHHQPPFDSDIDFHSALIYASGNQTLINTLMGDLYYQLQMFRHQCSRGRRPQTALLQHRQILQAITDGDGELAALLMRRHIEAGARHLTQVLQQSMEELI